LEGDDHSEGMLNDIGMPAYPGAQSHRRSAFEYGPRGGSWRMLRLFKRFDIRNSVLGAERTTAVAVPSSKAIQLKVFPVRARLRSAVDQIRTCVRQIATAIHW
jgi:hypothetical protein